MKKVLINESQFDKLMMAEAVDEGWLKNTAMAGAMGLATMFGGPNANAQNANYAQQNNVTQTVNQGQNTSQLSKDEIKNILSQWNKVSWPVPSMSKAEFERILNSLVSGYETEMSKTLRDKILKCIIKNEQGNPVSSDSFTAKDIEYMHNKYGKWVGIYNIGGTKYFFDYNGLMSFLRDYDI